MHVMGSLVSVYGGLGFSSIESYSCLFVCQLFVVVQQLRVSSKESGR